MVLRTYNVMILRDQGGWSGYVKIPAILLPVVVVCFALLIGGLVFWWNMYQEVSAIRTDPLMYSELDLRQKDHLFDLAFRIESMDMVMEDISAMNGKLQVMLAMDEESWQESLEQGDENADYRLAALAMVSYPNMIREMHQAIDSLYKGLSSEELHQQQILTELDVLMDNFTRIPSIWPTRGRYSSPFGYRRSPFTGKRDFHKGIDITASTGTDIIAPASGKVTYAGRFTSYGIIVELTHGNGIMTRFAHMSRVAVDEGDWVERGEVIGYVGNTGRSVAPHLHYEVHVNGTVANPINYILN